MKLRIALILTGLVCAQLATAQLGISGHRDRSFQRIVTGDFKKA